MVPFFYLAVLIYGSCSSSLEPIMEDLAKEDSKVHLNQTSVATSNNFMADLLAKPEEFVAQLALWKPKELKKIITLLSAFWNPGTSEAREHLQQLCIWNLYGATCPDVECPLGSGVVQFEGPKAVSGKNCPCCETTRSATQLWQSYNIQDGNVEGYCAPLLTFGGTKAGLGTNGYICCGEEA